MAKETQPRPTPTVAPTRVGLGVLVAVVAAGLVNTVVVALAARGVGTTAPRSGLTVVEYLPLTVFGVLAGTAGWWLVRRNAAHPRAVLRILVPSVVVVSFVPDLVLLANGRTVLNVAALMLMHLVVATVTVTTLARVLPVTGTRAEHVSDATPSTPQPGAVS